MGQSRGKSISRTVFLILPTPRLGAGSKDTSLSEGDVGCFAALQRLLIAPPPMKRGVWVAEENLIAESVKLAEAYQSMSQKLDIAFVNAGQWNVELTFDGVHFTEAGHRAFAEGLYAYLTK